VITVYPVSAFVKHGIELFLSSFVFYGLRKSITPTKTIFLAALTERIKAQEYESKRLVRNFAQKKFLTNRRGFDRVVMSGVAPLDALYPNRSGGRLPRLAPTTFKIERRCSDTFSTAAEFWL
jgi:hypothetical protein